MDERPRNPDQTMETTTPFDLNLTIQRWRENLAQSPAFQSENLNELESHLRDSVATLQTRGLSAEEAFMVATRRVGHNHALEAEFGKVNRRTVWLDRILWMLIGIQVWGFVAGVVGSAIRGAVSFALIGYDFTTYGRAIPAALSVFATLLGFAASMAVCWWLIYRRGSSHGEWAAILLQRPRLRHWTLIVVCGLSLLSLVMSSGMTVLLLKFTDMNKFGEIARSQQYSWIAGYLVQTTTFIILTVLLARKRLRLSRV